VAWISDLNMGIRTTIFSSSKKSSVAQVHYKAHFTEAEVRLRIPFDEEIWIVEVDAAPDAFWEEPSSAGFSKGTFRIVHAGLNRDDHLSTLFGDQFLASATPIERDLEIPFAGGGEKGKEEYRALVRLEPLVARAWQWSNYVKANLD
jgi:hypothetical protein